MSLILTLELVAVLLGLMYIILLIKQSIWCWPSGIIGSLISIFLFIHSKLYSEAILYGYYVLIGIYGWWNWYQPKAPLPIVRWGIRNHLVSLVSGVTGGVLLGYFFKYHTDADKPLLDAATTSFSFIASFMEAKKVLSGWAYWIVINMVTIGMYYSKSLDYYALLMAVYVVLSVIGYRNWHREVARVGVKNGIATIREKTCRVDHS